MSIEKIKATSEQVINRLPMVKGKGEEATKQALVLPMLDALGFDIWNPTEVCPEYEADFVTTKKQGPKEKVDYAIILDNTPRIYIEVKSVDIALDGHEGQLARYFNATTSVSLAILTNGIEYRFYTDTGDMNIMDPQPFHTTKFTAVDRGLEVFSRFHKSVFSPTAIRDFATQINYTTKISGFLRNQLDLGENNPSESFTRWILSEEGSYTGQIRAKSIERFQPIIKDALQIVLRDIVRRSVAALDKEVISPPQNAATFENKEAQEKVDLAEADNAAPNIQTKRFAIITTENELTLFAAVKKIFDQSDYSKREFFDKSQNKNIKAELSYTDNHIYFTVYINTVSNWIIRAAIDSKNPWIGFNIPADIGDTLVPKEYAKMPACPQSKFRIGYNKDDVIKPLYQLVITTLENVIKHMSV